MKLKLFVQAAVVLAVVAAVPALAGKPTKPYLTVDMGGVSVASDSTASGSFRLSGCGYSKLTTIIVWHNGTGPYTEVMPDADGCVSASFGPFGTEETGAYVGQAWQMQGNHWGLSAEVSFEVS